MAPQRDNTGNSNNVDNYSRRLAYAETTTEQVRQQNEENLMNIRDANIRRVTKATIEQQEEIQKFSLQVSKAVNDYQTQLLEKYTEKYGADLKKSAELQQKLQQQAIEFGKAKQEELRAQEFKAEQDDIFFIKNAKTLADLDIYNKKNELAKKQTQLEADARLLSIKEISAEQGYVDAEVHKSRIQTYTDELKTRLSIIDNENNQNLAAAQQANKERLASYNALIEAQTELTLAQQSGDSAAIQAAQDRLDKAQAEADLKSKEYKDAKKRAKETKKENKQKTKQAQKDTAKRLREEGATELEVMTATKKLSMDGIKEAVFSKDTANKVANNLINGVKEMFEATISTYGQYQSKINTRLQGSGLQWNGSNGIEQKIRGAVGSNPYVKLQAVMDNVVKATEQGIAYNIEQRAFLATVSENIASTFDVFNSNLARVIRLQQSDTTAARLGLEANLTSLFNSLYQDTSYLNDSFDTVSGNLTEAMSQMSSKEGVAFEYTVQKWLGALSSVGFSSDAISKISQAIGYLGSGDISSLSNNSEMQNLIVMAASRAGMSYSDILIDGLNSSNTNKLMKSMVEYLQEIANSDNKVVKSQYAQIFGMSVSDLKAVDNLSTTIEVINNTMLSYGGAMNELYSQIGQLSSRVSISGMLNNMMDNVKYTIGTSIASNPMTYALWEVTSMIEDLTGGIRLPTISAFGNSVDLDTTVTNLMRVGIVGVSTLGSIGSIISGLSGIESTFAPSSMLSKLGIENSSTANKTQLARGVGFNRKTKQLNQMSSSTMVGNASGSDYYQSTLASANEQTATTAEAAKEESTDKTTNDIYDYLVTVFDPKFTEIEKLLAVASGYAAKEESNTAFKSTDTRSSATNVTITYESADGKARVDTNTLLSTINGNVAEILTHVASLDKKALDNSMLSPSSVI